MDLDFIRCKLLGYSSNGVCYLVIRQASANHLFVVSAGPLPPSLLTTTLSIYIFNTKSFNTLERHTKVLQWSVEELLEPNSLDRI
jgi:hypothetical protein